MRRLAGGLTAAFAMFSVLPMPRLRWEEENLRYALCFLPLVGAVAGLLLVGWWRLALWLAIEPVFFAAVAVLLPIILSGGIHMDGLLDVCDAIGSHAEPERRLEIMKDPRAGAFAVLGCGGYLLLSAGLWTQLLAWGRWELAVLPATGAVVSRALDALSIAAFAPARSSGLAHLFGTAAARGPVLACSLGFAVGGIGLCVWAHPVGGLLAAALAGGYFLFHRRLCRRSFGGNTGDLAGFLVQMTELLFLLAAVVGGMIG